MDQGKHSTKYEDITLVVIFFLFVIINTILFAFLGLPWYYYLAIYGPFIIIIPVLVYKLRRKGLNERIRGRWN
nr:hypothetical protein [Sicyoidochytrium minutum DNA virus]